MAIVDMKRLRLFAMRSQKEDLLLALQKLGCVEIREPDDILNDKESAPLVKPEDDTSGSTRAMFASFVQSIKLLDHYAPVKTPLLAPKPEVTQAEYLDDTDLEQSYRIAQEIIDADERIRSILTEESRRRTMIDSLRPWKALDIPLETVGTESCKVLLGMLPIRTDWDALVHTISEQAPEAELYRIHTDTRQIYLCAFYLREEENELLKELREKGFTVASFGGASGTVAENLAEAENELLLLAEQKEKLTLFLKEKRDCRKQLYHGCDLTATNIARCEASQKAVGTDSVLLLEGYTPTAAEYELGRVLEPFDCAWELSEPDRNNIPDIPTELSNNALTRPLNMVTNMYSLPAYDGVDPNPLMMPFFVLFYGIMMADMGYGLLMMIAGLFVLKKKRLRGGSRHFCELLFECGITTFLMGAVTGGFFGDAPLQIAKMINPNTTFTGLPALFSPLNDTVYVLIGAMVLGFIQIITGMVINFVCTTKNGHFWDAMMDQGSWWLFFAGIGLGAAGITWWVAIAGVLALVLTQGRAKPTVIGKFVGGIASLYDVTSYLGDILSYSRLMALMLAGSVIAQVFNTLGAMPGNIFVFIPVFLVGHAINFGLNLLGCYVHDLRLQCLEFFNKFYKDGGRPFKPLVINPKYVDIAN